MSTITKSAQAFFDANKGRESANTACTYIAELLDEIERLTAENERLRAGISSFVAAWDSLPVGDHSVRAVQDWRNSPALKSSVLGLKAFQQLTPETK